MTAAATAAAAASKKKMNRETPNGSENTIDALKYSEEIATHTHTHTCKLENNSFLCGGRGEQESKYPMKFATEERKKKQRKRKRCWKQSVCASVSVCACLSIVYVFVYTTITLEGHHFFVATRDERTKHADEEKKIIILTSFINITKANEMLFNFLFHSVSTVWERVCASVFVSSVANSSWHLLHRLTLIVIYSNICIVIRNDGTHVVCALLVLFALQAVCVCAHSADTFQAPTKSHISNSVITHSRTNTWHFVIHRT